jgi:hypothetical protein
VTTSRKLSPFDSKRGGTLLCGLGLALVLTPSLLAAAAGVECLAAAFWVWARAADDAGEQVTRWGWLRRPATALWLAVAIHAAFPALEHGGLPPEGGPVAMARWVEAIAVLWAGLELLAALPLARRYSDLPGPWVALRPWFPVVLPTAGFLVLWQQSPHWIEVDLTRRAAEPLLLLTAALAALRAFARRQWTASLRWLVVSDSALAALLVAHPVSHAPGVSLLLWLGATGGHAFLLAGELRGASTRRGPFVTRLWIAASWSALTLLTWPVLLAVGAEAHGGARALTVAAAAFTAALAAWVTASRLVEAPERRSLMRARPAVSVTQLAAIAVLATGPVALAIAWWAGFEPPWHASLLAILPSVAGGGAALLARRRPVGAVWDGLRALGQRAPAAASWAFRLVVGLERRLVGLLAVVARAVTAPMHDLHTGDAQEYLLFLVGLGVLALVLPLLQ